MSGCAHMNPNDACASCWREKWNATLDREARWIEKLGKVEAQLAAVRDHWPHIEIGERGERRDPGALTCLRCKIESLIAAAQPEEKP